jgi:hypothetical protein
MDRLSPWPPRRNASFESLRLEPLSRILTVSNDGYDYTDEGVAPEDAPTTGRQPGRPEKIEPAVGDANRLAPPRRIPDDTLRLWTRWIDGGWRPKVPDEESAIAEPPPATPKNAQVPASVSSTARQQHIRDFEIMHNWTQNMDHDEPVFHLNIVHRTAENVQTATGAQKASIEGHIRWM